MADVELQGLLQRIQSETGHSREIDLDIGRQLGGVPLGHQAPDYTASVDACLALIGRVLPGWHWHVGYGAKGVFPYASIANERVPDVAAALETGCTRKGQIGGCFVVFPELADSFLS